MTTYAAVVHRIRSYVTSSGLTAADVARRAGVAWNSVAGLYDEKRDWLPSARTLMKVEAIVPESYEPPPRSPTQEMPKDDPTR